MTSKWHHSHLYELGGESSKPIQEVVTSQTVLEGEPSTSKMVMMPTHSLADLIENTYSNETNDENHEDMANQHSTNINSLVPVVEDLIEST